MPNHGILAETRHFGKITASDKNHGFRDFLLSLIIIIIIHVIITKSNA